MYDVTGLRWNEPMPATLADRHVVELSQKGASFILSVANVPEITVRALDHETWGAAVVTVQKVYGGDAVDFSPAVTISASSPTAEQVDVAGVLEIRLIVTTEAAVGFGRIGVYGKETQA